MPPEPAPWERKESAFRERKHERAPPDAGTGGQFPGARWRDGHCGTREFYPPSPRRPPSGHYKQAFADDTPPRSEDEGFRCYSGRYGSSSGRDGVGMGYLRRLPWNSSDGSRPHHDPPTACGVQRSVVTDLPKTLASVPSSSPPFASLKDHRLRSGGDGDVGSGAGKRQEREPEHSLGSIAWKPLKWSRSGSFALQPSSSSTEAASSEPGDGKSDVPPLVAGKGSAVQSQGDPLLAVDDGNPRKKHRLGWGQGLAKFEKEKVEGSEVSNVQSGLLLGGNGSGTVTTEPRSDHAADGDAVLVSLSSPQSGSGGSPSALEDKSKFIVEVSVSKKDASISIDQIPENCLPDVSIDIEDLDVNSLSHVRSCVADLLSVEDTSTGDLSLVRQSALDKLLLLKGEISKLVEKSESIIESYETELKNLNDNDYKTATQPQVDCALKQFSICTSSSSPYTNRIDGILASSATPLGGFLHRFRIGNCEEIHPHTISDIEEEKPHSKDFLAQVEIASSDVKTSMGDCDCFMGKSEVSCIQVLAPADDPLLCNTIMESNRDSARNASEVFSEFSACAISPVDVLENDKVSSTCIKEKMMVCKRALRFKERVLTLKYKTLYHLWREDLRLLNLLSTKKNPSKLHKRCEGRYRLSQNEQQKPRSLTRPRFPVPASNTTLVPTGEILGLTSQLISDSEIHIFRKNLKMPALILDERDKRHSIFVTNNGPVEDPILIEKEKSLINPWTEEEQKIFMDKLAVLGKDFRNIASFLDHKTIADCIEFYYKNHKLESFEPVRKILRSRKLSQKCSNTFMGASFKKWKNEPDSASLAILGAASVIVSHSHDAAGTRQKSRGKSFGRSNAAQKMSRGSHGRVTVDSLAETTAADVLAGIGSAMSSEGVSSCVTSSIDPVDKSESVPVDCHPLSEAIHTICEEDAYSDETCGELDLIDWSDDEKSVFVRALRLYGKDFARISLCLGTRSKEQCRVFFIKAQSSLGLDMVYHGLSTNEETPPLSDVNGGRSDTDEAYVTEMDSTLCSTQSCSKLDAEWSEFKKLCSQEAAHVVKRSPEVPLKLDDGFDAGNTKESSAADGGKLYSVLGDTDVKLSRKAFNQYGPTSGLPADTQLNCSPDSHVEPHTTDDMDAQGADFQSLNESGVPTVSLEDNDLNTLDDAVQRVSGRFPIDLSDSKTVYQPVKESFLRRKKPLAKSYNNGNRSFDKAFGAGNIYQGKYSSYFLDTIFGTAPQLPQGQTLPPLPRKKSQTISWKPKNSHSSSKPIPLDSNKSIIFGELDQVTLPAKFMLEGDEKHPSSQVKDNQPYTMGTQFLAGVDQSGHVLRGYPLHLLHMKENGFEDMHYQKPVSVGNLSKKNGDNSSSQFSAANFTDEKSNNASDHLDPLPTYACNARDSGEMLIMPCSRDTGIEAAGQQQTRTGDVKLFGKILSHPSPVQKPVSAEVTPSSTKEQRFLNFRFPNGDADGTCDPSNAERSCHLGLAAELDRSYDWLDGNKVQTCLSSMATSALCLSKCPSVISGVAYHPKKVKPVNTGSVLVHQGLFPQDGKGQLVFPNLQNRVRVDATAGFLQPARMAVNMVGGVDALACTIVSDPVAAMRLHFAKQIAPLGSSEDSQRGDLGSR